VHVIDRFKSLEAYQLEEVEKFEDDFETLQNPFENFPFEHMLEKYFKEKGQVIMPVSHSADEREEY